MLPSFEQLADSESVDFYVHLRHFQFNYQKFGRGAKPCRDISKKSA